MARRLPLLERILTYVHGIYYLRGPTTGLHLALIALMLAASWLPTGSGAGFIASVAAVWLTVFLCDLFRQRFFLDVKNEWGIHWRSTFVSLVKWPYFVVAFWDAIRAQYGTYTLTPKGDRTLKALSFGAVHMVVCVTVGTAWLVNLVRGPSPFVPIHIAAGLAVFTSLMAAITSTWTFPPDFASAPPRVLRPDSRPAREVTVPVPLSVEPLSAFVRHMPPAAAAAAARAKAEEQLRALG